MLIIRKSFADKFWIYGEVFDETSLPEPARTLYDIPISYLRTALKHARSPTGYPYPFFAGYAVNGSFNAVACDTANAGLVCIHSSVPILLFLACVNYATRCDIGDALPKRQDNALISFDDKIVLPGHLNDSQLVSATIARTVEDLRQSILSADNGKQVLVYGLFLYDIAIRFVAMHESMHIILGHAAYLKKHFELDVFAEFSAERDRHLEPKFNQSLEFLADRNCACGILTQVLNGNTLHPFSTQIQELAKVDFRRFVFRSVVQAYCILFHLLPYKLDDGLTGTFIKTHPHPYVRMQWINTEIGYHVLRSEDEFTEEIVYPFACAAATLANNFVTPNTWISANAENIDTGRRMFSDLTYGEVSKRSRDMQASMWEFAPLYKGFTRGWESE